MKTDELVHHLRSQAEEVQRWSMPPLPPLPTLRTAPDLRTNRRRATLLVLASAAAVVLALVVLPRLVEQPRTATPPHAGGTGPDATATPAPVARGSRTWVPLRCFKHQREGCDLPWELRDGSLRLTADPRGEGGSVPTSHRAARTSEFSFAVPRDPGDRWLLVGAHGSGAASRLRLTVGDGPEQSLPSGRPTLVRLPASTAGSTVVVREDARPLPREILLIGLYVPGGTTRSK